MTEVNTVPIIEVVKGVFKFVNNPLPVIDDALQKYGNTYITRIIGGKRLIMSTDLEVVQHVLQKNNRNYIKSEIQTDTMGKYVGNGLLTANGDYWLRQRRLIQPSFYKSKLSSLVQIIADEIDLFCDDLALKVKANPILDINEEMMELTLRIVSKSLFSTGINTDQVQHLGETFTELQEDIIREIRRPFAGWYRKLNGRSKRTETLAEATRQIVQDLIDDRRRSGVDINDDLLDMLLMSKYEDTGKGMTDQQILDEAIILFVAGHETTAVSMGYTLYELSKNKALYDSSTAQSKELMASSWTFERALSPDQLTYVLEESMRHYPPAWILDRKAIADDKVGTLDIKADDLIGLYVYGIHHDERFHSHPSMFDPTRHLPEAKKKLEKYAHFPFGGGPRMCIGHHFAMMEMKMALAALLDRFKFERMDDTSISFQPLITLRPKNPIMLKITEKQ